MRCREKIEDLVAQFDLQGVRFLAQDRHARFDIGRLQLRGQAPLETGNQAMFEVRDLRRRPIAREDDLLMAVEERVEGVEKFLLGALLAAEELDVVDQEQVRLAVALAEFDQVVVLDRVDEFVDEEFAREIHHLGVFLFAPDVLADRLHQVRLAESDAAVNEERIVGLARAIARRRGWRRARSRCSARRRMIRKCSADSSPSALLDCLRLPRPLPWPNAGSGSAATDIFRGRSIRQHRQILPSAARRTR